MAGRRWIRLYPGSVGEGEVSRRCRSCRERARELGAPPPEAMECWKIIYEAGDRSRLMDAVEAFKGAIGAGERCWIEYREPDELSGERGAAIVTCFSYSCFRGVWSRATEALYRAGAIDKPFLPYRRGGSYYDREYGPWRLWAIRYYPERLPVHSVIGIKIVCPNDMTPMEHEGRGFRCGLCSLYIPETLVYEALELGEAYYLVKAGFHRGSLYRLVYRRPDRIAVERL